MKKKILITAILIVSISFSSFCQDGDAAFLKGQSNVSLGYGFLSPFKTLFKLNSMFAADPNTTVKYSSTGPIGLTYEFGATDKIGAGIQIAYGTIKNVTTDKDGISTGKDYITTETLNQLSAIARVNYHFGSSSKFDPYAGLGLGYGNFKYKTTTNDPTDTPADLALFTIKVPTSFGITGQLGAKYYFSSNVGAYVEVGYLAGSFAQVGITAKF